MIRSYYYWFRLWWAYQRIRFNRLWLTVLYGRKAVARAVAITDQELQDSQDAFKAKVREMDEKYEEAVRKGEAKPMPKRLSDHDWFP